MGHGRFPGGGRRRAVRAGAGRSGGSAGCGGASTVPSASSGWCSAAGRWKRVHSGPRSLCQGAGTQRLSGTRARHRIPPGPDHASVRGRAGRTSSAPRCTSRSGNLDPTTCRPFLRSVRPVTDWSCPRPGLGQLARRYSPMARRITSQTLTCSLAARISRARLSSGSSRTDPALAADPSGGRPPARSAAQECRHVVAALGLIDRRLDIGVGDRRPVLAVSVVIHACSRLPFGSSRRYRVRIGMAWMTAGPAGRSITTSSSRFPARSGPGTSSAPGRHPPRRQRSRG